MNRNHAMQYLGFHNTALGRECPFAVRQEDAEPRHYVVTIANEAFTSGLARYQDGPDICSLRLQRELAASGDSPSETHLGVTDAELTGYRNTREPKIKRRFGPPQKT